MTPLVEVDDLHVSYGTANPVHAVRGVSLDLHEGQFVGLLGESGSGKSTLGNAMLRLLDPPARITGGRIRFAGTDITELDDRALRSIRWRDVSTVFQSSMSSLNPVITIEAQFADVIEAHTPTRNTAQIRARVGELLEMVMIDPSFMRFYPHELSGGMKQRACLALALALQPRFVLLDEPTTGLDVVVQREILDNLRTLQKSSGFAVLLISHDLGTVMEISDRVLVMYAGEIVEAQPAAAALTEPLHPYTHGLLRSYADPRAKSINVGYIPGRPPDLTQPVEQCAFAPRCSEAISRCWTQPPELVGMRDGLAACHVAASRWLPGNTAETPGSAAVIGDTDFVKSVTVRQRAGDVVVQVDSVSKTYHRRRGLQRSTVRAVDDVSFSLDKGRVTALVGQSGSGKSTIAKLITGVERPDSGRITFDAEHIDTLRRRGLRALRRRVQLVFQDPYAALNPTRTIGYALSRPIRNYLGLSGQRARERVEELLETVGLSPASSYTDKYPHQLSGGQRQRVVVARALAPDPAVLVADEPVSMLDVSVRAEILELLDTLVRERSIAMLYITHDLLSARMLADEILVLQAGQLVESGAAQQVVQEPRHEYTKLLLDALPNPYAAVRNTGSEPPRALPA